MENIQENLTRISPSLSPLRLKCITMSCLVKEWGISKRSITNLWKNGEFPQPFWLTKKTLAFYEEEINEWLRNRPRA